ncbi:MAG: hypothetical protein ACYCZP_02680 [Acidimicrobiales bacterium]
MVWLVAQRSWKGYVWPLPAAIGAYATLAYVEPTATLGASTTPTPTPIAYFASFAAFAAAVADDALPAGLRYVAYDPEKWSATPLNEQQDPVTYLRAFTELANAHGLGSVLVPARDLMLVTGGICVKRQGETLSQAFLRCDIAAGSVGADYFVVQGAPVEVSPSTYQSLVRAVSAQVQEQSPGTAVLATVNPARAPISSLATLLQSTRPYVSGYEVNCTPATVETAAELMALVDNSA